MPVPKHKRPGFGAKVEELKKQPRLQEDPERLRQMRPVWLVGAVDWEGPFGWGGCDDAEHLRDLQQRLANFETMSWSEIEQAGSHNIPIEELDAAARNRLAEIAQDDADEIFSLRISGKRRVFGFREGAALRIVWWDSDHKVCPVDKKHT